MKTTVLKRTKTFYRNKDDIPKIILKRTGKAEVIYGARAINKYLPDYLKVYTDDYDIYAKNPKKEAREVEKALDKHFGGNYFKVEPAQHPGTFRVKSRIDGKTYADYSPMPKKVNSKKIRGKNYITIEQLKKQKRKTLRTPTAKFRHTKDRDALNRLNLAAKVPRIKKKKKKKLNALDRQILNLINERG